MLRSYKGKSPQIHPSAFVSETAYIVGNVEIEANVNIWPGAVIRADSGHLVIRENSCIQDNSTVHADRDAKIGPNVVIGHNVLCHADLVGEYVLIGSGAIVNGGTIGEYSVIGSGTVVLEGSNIPPRSVVLGCPGRVTGPVQERHIELPRQILSTYIQKGKTFKEHGL